MTMRTVTYFGTVALLSQLLLTLGCGSNSPATTAGAGGAPVMGGAVSMGGATAPALGGAPGNGGSSATTGAGTGGSTVPAAGGNTATGGSTGSTEFLPLCATLTTAAGVPTKGGVCTAADPQLCWKTCGPQSIGFKSETCTGGTYVESASCSYPAGDYSCYKLPKLPATIDPTCSATAPQANTPCTLAPCTPCNVSGGYLDSTGSAKTGYCVCPASTTGSSKWSCASNTAWPCPSQTGC